MQAESKEGGDGVEFDAYAENYEEALDRGLSLTGEGKAFFAEGRILWLKRCLGKSGRAPKTVLDFGCGTGGSTPFFFRHLGVERSVGLDPSEESLEVARAEWGHLNADFRRPEARRADEVRVDLGFCNGVFHHILPDARAAALKVIFDGLEPGGIFAFWENNPWNPVVRYMMRRVPFDADAILVWPSEARRLLRGAGFEVLRTDYCFVFPRRLAFLRGLEGRLCKVPLGGQYQVLCRKPVR